MKKKRKHWGWGLLYIALVGMLLAGAFYVPEILTRLQDRHTLGQVNTQLVELNTYKLSYENFGEKLHTIARAVAEGTIIDTIQLIEDSSAVSNEELTEFAMQEVEELLNARLGMNICLSLEDLESRELYSIFSRNTGGSENLVSGIQFYKLTYDLSEAYGGPNMYLVLYLDAEFHKLYAFCVDTMAAQVATEFGVFATEEAKYALREREEYLTNALLDYWELTEDYRVSIQSYDAYGAAEKVGGLWGEDYVIFEEDSSQITIIREVYWQRENCYIWNGINSLF